MCDQPIAGQEAGRLQDDIGPGHLLAQNASTYVRVGREPFAANASPLPPAPIVIILVFRGDKALEPIPYLFETGGHVSIRRVQAL